MTYSNGTGAANPQMTGEPLGSGLMARHRQPLGLGKISTVCGISEAGGTFLDGTCCPLVAG